MVSSTPPRATRALRWALCAGYFLVLLDVTVVNVALPAIGSSLGARSGGLALVVDAYAVPLALLLLLAGAAGDRWGHRRWVLLGFGLFGAASVGCAVAPSLGALAVARACQGVGAAAALPCTLALLVAGAADERERARLVGLWAGVGGAALPAGPLLGGVLVDTFGWRAVFWLNVPLIVVAWVVVRRHAPTTDTARDRAAGSPAWGRSDTSRVRLVAACAVAGLMNFGALGALFLLTQSLQDVHGLSALEAGLTTLPAMVPLPLMAPIGARLCLRYGVWRTVGLGLAITGLGFAAVALTLGSVSWVLLLGLACWGSGLGILTPAVVAAALAAAPHRAGLASGASNTARQAGGALGVAVMAAFAGGATAAGAFLDRARGELGVTAAAFVAVGVATLIAARVGHTGQSGRRRSGTSGSRSNPDAT